MRFLLDAVTCGAGGSVPTRLRRILADAVAGDVKT